MSFFDTVRKVTSVPKTADRREWVAGMLAKFQLPNTVRSRVEELYQPDDTVLLTDYARELREAYKHYDSAAPAAMFEKSGLGALLDGLDDTRLRTVVKWTLLRQATAGYYDRMYDRLGEVIARLVPRMGGWSAADISFMLRCAITDTEEHFRYHYFSTSPLFMVPLSACERADDATLRECAEELLAADRHLAEHMVEFQHDYGVKARLERQLLRLHDTAAVLFPETDAFGAMLRDAIPAQLETPGLAALLLHCETLSGTKPSAVWRRKLEPILAALPDPVVPVRAILEQLPQVSDDVAFHPNYYYADPRVPERTVRKLRGLMWCLDVLPREDTSWAPRLLGRIARQAGTGKGGSKVLRAERLASVAIAVLAARVDDPSVAALAQLTAKVTKKTVVKAVQKALDAAATRLGLTRDQLTDRTVPTFGLGPDGVREEALDDYTVRFGLDRVGNPMLAFLSPAGKTVKSLPKAVRDAHADGLKALRAELKELKVALPAERFRLECALGEGRAWDLPEWQQYCLHHPITGHYARQLIWEISPDGGQTWQAGLPEPDRDAWRLVDVDGTATPCIGPAQARLWHPIRAEVSRVRAWRSHFLDAELRQPIKQAFREIYLLTPAEEDTGVYSNRYAGHILKYGQAKALLTTRGWSGAQLGHWDGGWASLAQRVYRDAATDREWTAYFHIDLVEREADNYMTVSYCASDQVRFTGDDGENVPLAELPPLLFSEVMRDLDLVVGVTSIAADPEWSDGGEDRHTAYWRRASFGELTESAEMRRTALERLIPRLKISERLELTDRFLRVRGDLHTYNIHLGSANILMEPDDAYLCIVPTRHVDRLYLPFESDGGRLSVILSKAFLLADDTAITDPTITRQLQRGR